MTNASEVIRVVPKATEQHQKMILEPTEFHFNKTFSQPTLVFGAADVQTQTLISSKNVTWKQPEEKHKCWSKVDRACICQMLHCIDSFMCNIYLMSKSGSMYFALSPWRCTQKHELLKQGVLLQIMLSISLFRLWDFGHCAWNPSMITVGHPLK